MKQKAFVFLLSMLLLASLACRTAAGFKEDIDSLSMTPPALPTALAETGERQPAEEAQGENPVADVDAPSSGSSVSMADEFTIVGAPEQAKAYRWADGKFNENRCTLPGAWDMCGTPGVYSVLSLAEVTNDSAVLITPDTQESLENETAQKLLYEGGYMYSSTNHTDLEVGNYFISLLPKAGRSWNIVLRGLNVGEGDLNQFVKFSNYDVGANLVTLFPVKDGANGFFDQGYTQQNADNSLSFKNCGIQGCDESWWMFFDTNNGAYTVMRYANGVWTLIYTNVVAP